MTPLIIDLTNSTSPTGKSTLSDCLLELTGNITSHEKKAKAQFTDTLKVERERGITVKAQTASMIYHVHIFGMNDTPRDE